MRTLILCVALNTVAMASCGPSALPGATGVPHYVGTVVAEWMPNGRDMKLREDFAFVDAAGTVWKAPRGAVINGASIPQALWWSGGPFEGVYRTASVVHARADDYKTDPSGDSGERIACAVLAGGRLGGGNRLLSP